jgi:hypothetical protein
MSEEIKSNSSAAQSNAVASDAIAMHPISAPQSRKDEPIQRVLKRYLIAIRGIGKTAQIALPHITQWNNSEIDKVQKKIKKFLPGLPAKGDGRKTFTLESARDFAEFTGTIRKLEELRSHDSTAVLAKSLFTQLFAEFDAYIGELLKVVYIKNDKLLKGISREISLTDLLDFEDLNAVKLAMLEKEIETFRRDSYIEQFSTLEKKFNLTLKKFKEWPEFVELSQRRNILTHNGGMVSDQYLVVCAKEGHKFLSKPKIGDPLGVTYEYYANASRLLSKVGLMLAYTLWSKVFPDESDLIHTGLNDTIFNALQQERWRFVSELEDFVLSDQMRKGISDIDLRIRIINASIGIKFSGEDPGVEKLLNSVDWSASYRDFKLATSVLNERYEDAIVIMKSIGKRGEIISQTDYHTWPLFHRFRERPEFYDAYFEIYGEAFAEKVEVDKGSVEAHAKTTDNRIAAKSRSKVIDVEINAPKFAKSKQHEAETAKKVRKSTEPIAIKKSKPL